ncbi:MAG: phospholipase A [Pseudomonadota bacterium]
MMTKKYRFTATLLLFISLATTQYAHGAQDFASYEECLMQTLKTAPDSLSVSQLRKSCNGFQVKEETDTTEPPQSTEQAAASSPELTAVSRRVSHEAKSHLNLFSILPHKPNYILVGSYNDTPNGDALNLDDSEIDNTEIKFQVSFKVPLVRDLLGDDNGHLYAAYTMKSFWQAYNNDISSPFRETNHEPELFFALRSNKKFLGWNNPYILAGFSHQSNGRSGSDSRSWNRLYLDFILEKGDFALSIKPWYRLPESDKSYLGDPSGDDNPDISEYMGYGELTGAWAKWGHTVSILLRNNLRRHDNRGAVELGWSFPLSDEMPLRGYLQYFNGYGESLIDYNSSTNRIGFGVLLTDWL